MQNYKACVINGTSSSMTTTVTSVLVQSLGFAFALCAALGAALASSMSILENVVLSSFLVVVGIAIGWGIMSRLKHVVSFLVLPVHGLLGSNNTLGFVSVALDGRNSLAQLFGAGCILDVTNKRCHVLNCVCKYTVFKGYVRSSVFHLPSDRYRQ